MNLSFSTRGWGDLSWDQMLQEAVDMRFGGVEVYNLFKFPSLTDRGGPFHAHRVAATIRQLRDLKLKIPCFDTSVDLSSDPEAVTILAAMLENARNLDRVLKPREETLPQEEDQAVEDTAYFQMRQRIMELLSTLPETDAKVLTLRFGLEGGMPLSPEETGRKLGLTSQEVVEKEANALIKLRQQG